MKKAFKIFLGIILFLIVSIVLIPILFKNKIKEIVIQEFAKQTTSTLYFDGFKVSLFGNFPDLTVSLGDFGIVGTGVFEGDTLVSAKSFAAGVGLREYLFDDQIVVKNIDLNSPNITILTLEDGLANYDIMRPSEEVPEAIEEPAEGGSVNFGIQSINITNGNFIYYDQSIGVLTELAQLDLSGTGNFEEDIFDLVTKGRIGDIEVAYDGTYYLSRKSLDLEAIISMDLPNSKYTFKENSFKLNSLPLEIDGYLQLLDDRMDMDFKFGSPGVTIKSLISLIPGVYASSLEGLQANGNVTFDGAISGAYSDTEMPSFNLGLAVANGNIQHPQLPKPIQNAAMNLQVQSEKGAMDKTYIDLSKLHLEVGNNPFDATLALKNLDNPEWDFKTNGQINLEEFVGLLEQEGLVLKGQIVADLSSKGKMSDLEAERYQALPTQGTLSLKGFEYVSPDLPHAVTIASTQASFNNNEVVLSEYKGSLGSTNLDVTGKLQNMLGFAFNNEVLTGQLTAHADQLIVSEWMTEEEGAEAAEAESEEAPTDEPTEVVRIPENINFKLRSTIDKVVYNKLNLNSLQGNIDVAEGKISLVNSGLKTLGGDLVLNGSYDTKPEQPEFDMNISAKQMSIAQSFESVDMVQKLAPIAEQVSGMFGMGFSISGGLTADMMPDYTTLNGSGLIELAKAGFDNPELFSKLSTVTKLQKLDNPVLDKLKMQAEISAGRLFIKPFDIKLGDYMTTIAGSTGIDGSVDYEFRVIVPAGEVGAQVNSLISSFTGADVLSGKNVVMNLGMTGQFNDPQFKLKGVETEDGQSVGGAVKASLEAKVEEKKQELEKELEKKKQEAKDSLNNVIEAKKDSLQNQLDSLVNKKADTLSTVIAEKLGIKKDSAKVLEEAKDKAKNALENLLKKKKKKNDNN